MSEVGTPQVVPANEAVDSKDQTKVSHSESLKKRVSRRKRSVKHRMLRHQGSSSLEPMHRQVKKYGHIQRVKFAIFLKILMQQLSMTDKELHLRAQEMVLECIKSQREGKLQGTPLMSALKGRLYGLVGQDLWEESERYLQTYIDYHNIRTDL